jgi:hypothetical protein
MRPSFNLRALFTLKGYVILSTTVIGSVAVAAFTKAGQPQKQRFDEIDVQRINVIEPDGTLRVVLTNHAKMPDIVYKGKEYKGTRGGAPGPGKYAGLLFYNSDGTEDGGLMYGSAKTPDGQRAGAMLTMDQFEQNESLTLSYGEVNGQRASGLSVNDQPSQSIGMVLDSTEALRSLPESPEKARRTKAIIDAARAQGVLGGAQRFFAGRNTNKESIVDLRDGDGKTRLRMLVDSAGMARIQFLDPNGKVTRTIGPDENTSPGSL